MKALAVSLLASLSALSYAQEREVSCQLPDYTENRAYSQTSFKDCGKLNGTPFTITFEGQLVYYAADDCTRAIVGVPTFPRVGWQCSCYGKLQSGSGVVRTSDKVCRREQGTIL